MRRELEPAASIIMSGVLNLPGMEIFKWRDIFRCTGLERLSFVRLLPNLGK